MNQIDIQNKVIDFLHTNMLMPKDGIEHQISTNLFDKGFIDSYGLIELITFLEETFEIKIDESEIADSSLDSIKNIVDTIVKKL